jgi:hypothetical protein
MPCSQRTNETKNTSHLYLLLYTGGVRSPYLDVPTDEQHLKQLYSSHEHYVDNVVNTTRELVLQRYITREDGIEIIRHAKKFRCTDASRYSLRYTG